MRRLNRTLSLALGATALATLSVGCESPVVDDPIGIDPPTAVAGAPPAHAMDAAVAHDLAALRRATARFHDFDAAVDAGHEILVSHPVSGAVCLEHPTDGGMGRHYVDPTLMDDVVSVAEPEAIIYEPTAAGRLRLVAVEYIVPFAVLGDDEDPPVLFGREFHRNYTFGVWALHAWAWTSNPSGTFADWNPSVSCEWDGAVGG
jgi:hypothetical protein